MSDAIRSCLNSWLEQRLEEQRRQWVDESCQLIADGNQQQLFLRFGLASRKIPKDPLNLSNDEREQAHKARPHWHPAEWGLVEAVRALLILSIPASNQEEFVNPLNRLFVAGEVNELVMLYQALPLYPFPEAHVERAAEGIRTNMRTVFCAVAHHNPYPAESLPQGLWNQMVLKCLFVEASLFPVHGLDERNNADLSKMLCDYAHERWAAKRKVHPELWRCVDVDRYPPALEDLKHVIEEGEKLEKQAATLSLLGQESAGAKELLEQVEEYREQATAGNLTWKSIYEELCQPE